MKLSEYINKLEDILQEHGDHDIVSEEDLDPDLPEFQEFDGPPVYVMPS